MDCICYITYKLLKTGVLKDLIDSKCIDDLDDVVVFEKVYANFLNENLDIYSNNCFPSSLGFQDYSPIVDFKGSCFYYQSGFACFEDCPKATEDLLNALLTEIQSKTSRQK